MDAVENVPHFAGVIALAARKSWKLSELGITFFSKVWKNKRGLFQRLEKAALAFFTNQGWLRMTRKKACPAV
jgi:hypothetical protein